MTTRDPIAEALAQAVRPRETDLERKLADGLNHRDDDQRDDEHDTLAAALIAATNKTHPTIDHALRRLA